MGIGQKLRDVIRPMRHLALRAIRALGYDLLRTDEPSRIIFSADGEDAIALSWLTEHFAVPKSDIRYLDIGAGDPCRLSNTFLLYRLGARGVLVEPDPDQVAKLRTKRPRDQVIQAGIAFDNRRSGTLYRCQNRLFNSFEPPREQTWSGPIIDRIEVPLMAINDVLAECSEEGFHFLSVDTEGFDYEIVEGIDFTRLRPLVICVELCRPVGDFISLLSPRGYRLIVQTMHNVMFALASEKTSSRISPAERLNADGPAAGHSKADLRAGV